MLEYDSIITILFPFRPLSPSVTYLICLLVTHVTLSARLFTRSLRVRLHIHLLAIHTYSTLDFSVF
jgi:hypothetical protein